MLLIIRTLYTIYFLEREKKCLRVRNKAVRLTMRVRANKRKNFS